MGSMLAKEQLPHDDKDLEKLLNEPIKVYLVNGTALTGRLIRYDEAKLVLSPETLVYRKHVTTIHRDNGTKDDHARRSQSPVR